MGISDNKWNLDNCINNSFKFDLTWSMTEFNLIQTSIVCEVQHVHWLSQYYPIIEQLNAPSSNLERSNFGLCKWRKSIHKWWLPIFFYLWETSFPQFVSPLILHSPWFYPVHGKFRKYWKTKMSQSFMCSRLYIPH